jgi:hypothetical protein
VYLTEALHEHKWHSRHEHAAESKGEPNLSLVESE